MNNELETLIGLEIHMELLTETKMYCSCKNTFGKMENTVVCPICSGYPGSLPNINQKAAELAVRAGLALNCKINRLFKMERKNYFYPDLPKGYQISQLYLPVCENGYLEVKGKKYLISNIHLEEDAGKLGGNGIDLNRCGIPLIEIVTEPCFNSAEETIAFLKELRLVMIYAGVSDCRIEQGSMRCDVNVSVHRKNSPPGERCELKNVSGFTNVFDGIIYEEKRQRELLVKGEKNTVETRRWDSSARSSVLLRTKENAEDYRYFEEPDLPAVVIDEEIIKKAAFDLPKLPAQKRSDYVSSGLTEQAAEDIIQDPRKDRLFVGCEALGLCCAKTVSSLVNGIAAEYLNSAPSLFDKDIDGICKALCRIGALREKGAVSSTSVRILFEEYLKSGSDIYVLVQKLRLEQVSDGGSIEKLVNEVLLSNEKSISDYKKGKTNALAFLVGQCMKRSGGKTDPVLCKEAILKKIEE